MLIETASTKLRETDTVAAPAFTPSTVGERWDAAFTAQRDAYNVNSAIYVKEQSFDASSDAIFALTGQRLDNPFRASAGSYREGTKSEADLAGSAPRIAAYESALNALAEQHPDKADQIRQHGNVLEKSYARRNASVAQADDTVRRSSSAVNVPFLGPLDPVAVGGGIVGSLFDPVTTGINMLGSAGQGGKLIYHAARAALINGAAEVAVQPFIKDWANQAGDPYTWSDAGRQVLASALLGGALDAGVRGTARALKRPEAALDAAAQALPPEHPVAKAYNGDTAAALEIAKAAGVADDPAVRGAAIAATDAPAFEARVPGVDDGEGLQALIDGLRHADDPDVHAVPVRPDAVPDARQPRLSDEAPAPVMPGRSFDMDGKPVAFRDVDLKQTITDAATFQFKRGGDSSGATERLRGVERWDPIAAGRAVIYERTDGSQVIADAHQRRSLALRLTDQETTVQAFVFREADGWTPGDVRAIAAKKNLQEGSGSAVDAAAIIRERPDIIDKSVPLTSEAMRQARSLARLSDEAFGAVVAGVVPPNYAALIGDLVPDRSRHQSMIDELAAADPANVREARLLVSDVLALPSHIDTQLTLLGATRVERSLLRERSKVLDAALQAMKGDARLFALLDREAGRIEAAGNTLADTNARRAAEAAEVATVIERLALTQGPVSEWLNDAARAMLAGMPAKRAGQAFARRVADTLEEDGLAGLMRTEAPLRAGGFAEPGGPEAQAQLKGLEQALASEIKAAQAPPQAQLFDLASARDARAQTIFLPGYGTPEFQASRQFKFGSETVVGYEAAVARLVEQSKAHAGPEGVAREFKAVVLIGPPGAGKSTVGAAAARNLRSAIVSADDPKFAIPEFDGGRGSSIVHEEASAIAAMVRNQIMAAGENVMIEKLGSSPGSIRVLVELLNESGYGVRVLSVTAPRETLLARIASRAEKTGRTVPIEEVDKTLTGIARTLEKLRQDARVSGILEVDNGGEVPRIIVGSEVFGAGFTEALQGQVRDAGLVRRSRRAGRPEGAGAPAGREGQAASGDQSPGNRPQEINSKSADQISSAALLRAGLSDVERTGDVQDVLTFCKD
jgi:predicted kinase